MNLPAAISLAAAALGLAVAGLALGLGSSRRWARYRLLAAVALFAALYSGLDVIATLELRPEVLLPLNGLQSAFAAFDVVAWMLYADRLLQRSTRLWQRTVRLAIVVLALGWLAPGLFFDGALTRFTFDPLGVTYTYPTPSELGVAMYVLEVTCLFITFARFVSAARRGLDEGYVHAAAIGISLAAAVYDATMTVGLFRGPFLLPLSSIAVVCMLGLLFTRAFIVDARQLDLMTEQLEHIVDERTKKLVATEGALLRAEKLAAIGQLSAGVAHEINNPAAAVSGNLEYLRQELEDDRIGDEAFACIDDSLEAIDRIARIVRQLLDIGRAAATAPAGGAANVKRAVEQALVSARAALPPAASVVTEVSADLFVRGDEASLVQVLLNLITNAGQAIAGSPSGKVHICAVRSGEDVVITVVDNGVGMSDETKRRLFEPFYTTKPFGKGTGLGLPLSHGIVRSLGGDMSVDSRPGETTMSVRLPAATAPSPVSCGRPRACVRRRTLLLVEDDERVRRALERTLSSTFVLVVASGVDDALRRLDEQAFDVILSDWQMPNGGGRRLYELAAKHRPDSLHGFVFMTAGALSPGDRSFLERHRLEMLDKPLALDELLAAVHATETNVSAEMTRPDDLRSVSLLSASAVLFP